MANVITILNKCIATNSNGEYAVTVQGTTGATPANGNICAKVRKSIDTTNDRVRVVNTQ